ncbi:hypothetical protein [Arthrobacter celericrescens]|nr:hypothetical protein [Arthrobacter celericrescens]
MSATEIPVRSGPSWPLSGMMASRSAASFTTALLAAVMWWNPG